jgi:hypothetical protein
MKRAQRSINHLLKINKKRPQKNNHSISSFYTLFVVPEKKPNINKEKRETIIRIIIISLLNVGLADGSLRPKIFVVSLAKTFFSLSENTIYDDKNDRELTIVFIPFLSISLVSLHHHQNQES